ncbi:hypothetical protein VHEMI07880 [[Torrubiella] hemipterigena]|uniref:RNA helicase n=1 Tax=[Torrubiella] hemipterigena TaxID=1531966 RepID=A0A0A1TBU0_9HYPO|nr:hypothetical protein VHEMI07880 [[Torrubiella] hemipterigena]
MAGTKKKKKAVANPARGFATTSIASKPRPETSEASNDPSSTDQAKKPAEAAAERSDEAQIAKPDNGPPPLSAEEFEKQLEESELQLLVEKFALKTKRDAQRQKNRLETDRRLLRGQADPINVTKWLPPDILDHILDLIKAESRFSASNVSQDSITAGKMPTEEETIGRLWSLQQTLLLTDFPEARVQSAIKYILDIAPNVSVSVKDSIWGLEEALEWLARECTMDELPLYENRPKPHVKDTPSDTPATSRSTTPKPGQSRRRRDDLTTNQKQRHGPPQKQAKVTYDSDIEPDDLHPQYLAAKIRLLEMSKLTDPTKKSEKSPESDEKAKLLAKLQKIENDVLFDKAAADFEWKSKRIELEKEFAMERNRQKAETKPVVESQVIDEEPDDSVNAEAERIAAELLAEVHDDDGGLGNLFDALPQSEVDPSTGATRTVMTSSDGVKLTIRDFGKWSGVNPRRVLEESCRSRDSNVKLEFRAISEAAFANRHTLDIWWTKPQEPPQIPVPLDIDHILDANQFTFTMTKVATPDLKQSEAYLATAALFHIFGQNSKEEKVHLKLPPVWRDFWGELAEAKKDELDTRDREVMRQLRDFVRQRQDQELEDGVILQGVFKGRNTGKANGENSDSTVTHRSRSVQMSPDALRKIWVDKSSTPQYQQMMKFRSQLPMSSFKTSVLQAVENNQVVIICGETGCGKSTQVPAFLLENELANGRHCKVYCTEPRRISALSLARRVSEELGEKRDDIGTNRSLVGYSIRLEANVSRETRLVYATIGIVMRMLEGSNDLQEVTHLVLDEVHERSIDSDFLLIVLRRLMKQRKDLKVVLMSATVDADRFSTYLGGAPILNVPGRTFPVEVKYLEDAIELTSYVPTTNANEKMIDLDEDGEADAETHQPGEALNLVGYSQRTRNVLSQMDEYQIDYDLIMQLLIHISSATDMAFYSKAILIFLPGIAEIRTLNDLILGDPRFSKDWLVYPLHSTIATEDQESAFLVPPEGLRKIVLATNIAETGITIPDVTCVIDTGKHREMRFDEKRQLSRLIDTFISKANAKQRRGRAGRVQNGLCFHMFTKARHDSVMSDQQTPEMLRLSLQDLAIRVKICKIGGIEETLGDALDPPSAKNIRRAIDALVDVRALTTSEELTPLGRQLARLPLDVFLGKLILLGTVFKCLDMAITLAAILSSKSPFSAPFGQRTQADNARAAFKKADSDLLTVYNAYSAWKRVCQSNSGFGKEMQFCRKNFLSQQTLSNIEDLKGQLLVALADSSFLSLTEEERKGLSRMRATNRGRRQQNFYEIPNRVNINSDNDVVACSVIAWSFYPKLLIRDIPGSKGVRNIGNNQSISIHPASVNRSALDIKWLSYYHIMQSKSIYRAHEITAVDAFAIALFCGDVRCDVSGVFAFSLISSNIFVAIFRCHYSGWEPSPFLCSRLEDNACHQGPSHQIARNAEQVFPAAWEASDSSAREVA